MFITDEDDSKDKGIGQGDGEEPAPISSPETAGGSPGVAHAPAEASRSKISERKRAANRANAQKSTGPRTGRGKSISRFNAVRHGLLSRQALFDEYGKPAEEDMRVLMESLREKYGAGDVASELLVELTVVDYYRNAKGLEYEKKLLAGKLTFWGQGEMPCLQRYVTANRNALLRDLQLLEKLRAAQSAEQGGHRDDSREECCSEPRATKDADVA